MVGSRDIARLTALVDEIQKSGIMLRLLHYLPILAVTINPFFPKYNRYRDQNYEIAWIDGQELYREMCRNISLPVVNIKEQGSEKLIFIIKGFLGINKK